MHGYIVVEKRAVKAPGQTVAASVSMLRSVVSFQSSWSEVQLVSSASSSHHGQKCSCLPVLASVIVVRSAVGFQCHRGQKYSWSPVIMWLLSGQKWKQRKKGRKKRTAAEVRKMKMDQQKQMIMFLNCVTKTKENHQVNEMSQSSQNNTKLQWPLKVLC